MFLGHYELRNFAGFPSSLRGFCGGSNIRLMARDSIRDSMGVCL